MSVPRKQDGWRPGTAQDLEAMYHFKQRFRELKMLLELIESGKLDMKVIRGLLPPETDSDAANKKYVDQKDTEVKTYVDTGLAGKAPANYVTNVIYCSTNDEILAAIESEYNKLSDRSIGYICLVMIVEGLALKGGNWIVTLNRATPAYGTAEAKCYNADNTMRYFTNSKVAGVWQGWVDCSRSAFAPAGFGLGETVKWIYATEKLADYIHSGFYSWVSGVSDAPFAAGSMFVIKRSAQYVYQVAFNDGVTRVEMAVRKLTNATWTPWEWINPPMALGTEYRTTERWKGKAVYTKALDCGMFPATAGLVDVKHSLSVTAFVECKAEIYHTGGRKLCAPYHSPNGDLLVSVNEANVVLYATKDGFNTYGAIVSLKYTKD